VREDIFRKVALDRLSSPEQLDELMQVTTSRSWAALAALFLLLMAGLTWGFVGTVPTKVQAIGILIMRGGLADVGATTSGQITAVYVERGDMVKEGQVVARLSQPELEEELAAARGRLAEFRADHESLLAFGTADQSLRTQEIAVRRANVRSEIRSAKERHGYLQSRLTSQEELLAKGLVTGQVVEGTRRELQSATEKVDSLEASLVQLRVEVMGTERRGEAESRTSELAINEAERKLATLTERLENSTQITSLHAGQVLELRAAPGDIVRSGTPILSIELQGEEQQPLEALLYIHSSQGKQVTPGMVVQVEPSVVRREEHGVVLADVTSVAEFPSTRHGMMRVLDNEELVTSFLAATDGMPIAVEAILRIDSDTPSGYAWSSGQGPQILLTSGTPCEASITTREQRPITLVLPILRSLLGT
jgi:HlyD family secretion protein